MNGRASGWREGVDELRANEGRTSSRAHTSFASIGCCVRVCLQTGRNLQHSSVYTVTHCKPLGWLQEVRVTHFKAPKHLKVKILRHGHFKAISLS